MNVLPGGAPLLHDWLTMAFARIRKMAAFAAIMRFGNCSRKIAIELSISMPSKQATGHGYVPQRGTQT
jgi:hypothetical protein